MATHAHRTQPVVSVRHVVSVALLLPSCSFIARQDPPHCSLAPVAVDGTVAIGVPTVAYFALRNAHVAAGTGAFDPRPILAGVSAGLIGFGYLVSTAHGLAKYGSCRQAPPQRDPASQSRHGEETEMRCAPIKPGSAVWGCIDGYRCNDDFEGCAPANGRAPLRRR